MLILTELSGRGYYGICSIVPRQIVPQLMENIGNLRPEVKERYGEWGKTNFDSDPWGRTGLDDSLKCLDTDNDSDNIRLGWIPTKIRQALISMELLELCNYQDFKSRPAQLEKPVLEISVGQGNNGWFVHANLGYPIWDVIEGDKFSDDILPAIKQRIQYFWEDESGSCYRNSMSSTFVHDGVNGKTLQLYHPVGNGLWITGSRKDFTGYQLIDHNTDTCVQALAHIYGLCVVLDECRKQL